MLLEDFITSNSSTASIADQVQQHFLPNSYGLAPLPQTINTMELGPPPVTRLVPDNIAAAARLPTNSASRVEAIKNLLCSESDSEFSALSGENSNLVKQNPNLPQSVSGGPMLFPAQLQASFSAIPQPIPRMSSGAAPITSIGDYRTPHHPYHIPLKIKIPNKIRLPPQKDGKRTNQHTYKAHAPGDGLLKIDRKPNTTAASIPGVPLALMMTERPYQSTIMTDHGILNIISSNEPGSKVPTPPPSYLSVNSNSTVSSSCSLAPSLASSSSLEDQAHAAMAMTSLSLTHSISASNGAIPKRARSRGGVGKKRTSFTRNQVCAMEQRFDQQRYLTSVERKEFSNLIGLDDHHVKIWFQNRRSKLKKQSIVSSSEATARSLVNIRAKPFPGKNQQPSSITSHVTKSEDTSSSTASSACQLTKPVPAVHPSHPTPATGYHPYMNGSIPACMAPPKSQSGVSYPSMNSAIASVTNSYPSSTIPAGVNACAAGTPFVHPHAHQHTDLKATTMVASAAQGHVPTMAAQMSATNGMTNGVPFQPPYGYVYDYGVDQGSAFVTQSSRSSSPFENFPFSPGFHCHPDDVGVNPFNQMAIVPPVNMM